jgi:putative DNA primase/helicase
LAHPLSQSVAAPLPASEARNVIKIFQGFTWERPTIDGRLVAGWCAIAPISGMLAWRPTLWFAGASGAGKSTMTSCIALLLGGMAYYVQGVTTEAGIRQGLRNDARPVIFDEAEGDDTPAKLRMQSIIELVRQSSTEGGAEIVKGTAGQTGAKRYKVRSCFAFSSVNVTLEQAADQSRITVLSMIHPRVLSPEDAKKREEDWEKLKRDKDMTLTSDWCAAFVARSVKMAPMIRQNAVTYADAAAKLFGNRRMGDQIGTLLAGAHSLESDDTLTPTQAESELVKYKKFFQTIEAEYVTDEQRLVHVILQMRVRASGGNMVYERTIGELLSSARPKGSISEDDGEMIPARIADAELKRLGIRYEESGSDKAEQRDSDDGKAERVDLGEGVWIANSNSNMQRLLANTPWSAQYRLTLQRLPGARKSSSMMKFGSSGTHRAVWVPMAAIFPN